MTKFTIRVIFFGLNLMLPWHIICGRGSGNGQSTHRHLYTTSSPHREQHTTQEMSVELLWAVSEGFPGVPHFAIHFQLQQQTGLSVPNFVYTMCFTHYSLQWHLWNLKSSNFHFLLNYSKGDEQQPRIWAHFEYCL